MVTTFPQSLFYLIDFLGAKIEKWIGLPSLKKVWDEKLEGLVIFKVFVAVSWIEKHNRAPNQVAIEAN